MSEPFIYPKSRIARRERPGTFADYRDYKPFLRREFERKCVYCRMPDSMKGDEGFGVDHYRPKHRFPNYATAYANLFYACNVCNQRKGSYWPPHGKGKTHFVPNPCDHEMYSHLRFAGPRVEARTAAGGVAEELLDLNDPEAIKYRTFMLDVIVTMNEKLRGIDALTQIARSKEATSEMRSLADQRARIEAHLARLTGS